MDITIDGTEFPGAMKVRFVTVEITDYDTGGKTLTPNTVGMNRFQSVRADVVDGSGYVATYDRYDDALVLRGESNDGTGTGDEPLSEAASGTSAEVSVMALGR